MPVHVQVTFLPHPMPLVTFRNCLSPGHVAILEWMLHHSLATGLERDDFGTTPIHDAADQNQLECLHVFYNHSVNLEPKDNEGLTPFNLAEEKQHFRSMQFLLNPKKSFEDSRRKSFDIKVCRENYSNRIFRISN